jgi:endonuclease V-like protein UPF0215 family
MRFPVEKGRQLRCIGFDDAPFGKRSGSVVRLAGIVCNGTRFEGMVWGQVRRDGWGATDAVCRLLQGGKFLPQVHLVLLDGIAFGGFNVVDLPELARRLDRPCVAVMRRHPNLEAVEQAIRRLPNPERRLKLLARAGPIHARAPFYFQCQGAAPDDVAEALAKLTDTGHVPEALRLAHLIGSAVMGGVSSQRA